MSVLLIVEDEAVLRRATAQAMERLPDVQVLTAGNLAEARAAMAREAPSLVISHRRSSGIAVSSSRTGLIAAAILAL